MTLTFRGCQRLFMRGSCLRPNICRPRSRRTQAKKTSRAQGNSYQVDPESPAVYITQSSKPMSLRAQKTPLSDTIARNPPPDPTTAILGT